MNRSELKELNKKWDYQNNLFLELDDSDENIKKLKAFYAMMKDLEIAQSSLKKLIEILIKSDFDNKNIKGYRLLKHDDDNVIIQRALFFSILVTFSKCFSQSRGRIRLDKRVISNILTDEEKEKFYLLFKIRNEYIAHGGISDEEIIYSIIFFKHNTAGVTCRYFSSFGWTKEAYMILEQIINKTLSFVNEEYLKVNEVIISKIEPLTHNLLVQAKKEKQRYMENK